MFFRLYSDLHNEFEPLPLDRIPARPQDAETVCLLAGDIHVGVAAAQYAADLAARFRAVVLVPGNHEYWKESLVRLPDKLRETVAGVDNVHILTPGIVRFDGVSVIGATLWTDFDKGNPQTQWQARQNIRDHKKIRTGTRESPYLRKAMPEDLYRVHVAERAWLKVSVEEELARNQKIVVVTHHAPTFAVVPERYKGDALNGAYASELMYEFGEYPITWCFGHLHNSTDMQILNVRLLSNPRGYAPHYLNPQFDPTFTFTV